MSQSEPCVSQEDKPGTRARILPHSYDMNHNMKHLMNHDLHLSPTSRSICPATPAGIAADGRAPPPPPSSSGTAPAAPCEHLCSAGACAGPLQGDEGAIVTASSTQEPRPPGMTCMEDEEDEEEDDDEELRRRLSLVCCRFLVALAASASSDEEESSRARARLCLAPSCCPRWCRQL